MGMTNIGNQYLGWKYSTPLQADYLDTFLAGFSNPGLFVRPQITAVGASSSEGQTFVIHPFSLLIEPNDKKLPDKNIDANGKPFVQKLVKVSVTENININVPISACAIGFYYDFSNNLIPQAQWYGDIVVLDAESITNFQGIIIATVQHHRVGDAYYLSVSTNGADISDALLMAEGWDPNCWLSVVRPNRALTGGRVLINKLEVRRHNEVLKDSNAIYMSGAGGVKVLNQNNTVYEFKKDPDNSNPDGTRGFMPARYNCFSLHSGQLSDGSDTGLMPKTWGDDTPPDCGSTLPITNQSGGIFAIVDAQASVERLPESSFVNKMNIYPVKHETYNVYFDNGTLYIK